MNKKITNYIDNEIKKFKKGKLKFNWEYELREDIYLNAKDKFIDQFGNEKDWYDGNMSWVFWCVCDKTDELVEQNLIKFYNKKEQANEKNNSKHS